MYSIFLHTENDLIAVYVRLYMLRIHDDLAGLRLYINNGIASQKLKYIYRAFKYLFILSFF